MTPLEVGTVTGTAIKDWVLVIAGNVFIIILVVRSVGYFAKKEWGDFIGHILVAVVIAGLIYATDTAITLFKGLAGLILGTPGA
jgi:hypothetical protein